MKKPILIMGKYLVVGLFSSGLVFSGEAGMGGYYDTLHRQEIRKPLVTKIKEFKVGDHETRIIDYYQENEAYSLEVLYLRLLHELRLQDYPSYENFLSKSKNIEKKEIGKILHAIEEMDIEYLSTKVGIGVAAGGVVLLALNGIFLRNKGLSRVSSMSMPAGIFSIASGKSGAFATGLEKTKKKTMLLEELDKSKELEDLVASLVPLHKNDTDKRKEVKLAVKKAYTDNILYGTNPDVLHFVKIHTSITDDEVESFIKLRQDLNEFSTAYEEHLDGFKRNSPAHAALLKVSIGQLIDYMEESDVVKGPGLKNLVRRAKDLSGEFFTTIY